MTGDLAVAGGELDRCVDDRHSGTLGGFDHILSVLQHPGGLHRGLHRTMQRSALAGEVVLELDEHDGGLGRVHGFS